MKRRVRVAVAAAVALLVVLPATASAHPLGNFSINHYAALVVRPGAVDLDVVIDMAEIPTLTEIALLDTDGDGRVSGDELEASRETRCEALIPDLAAQRSTMHRFGWGSPRRGSICAREAAASTRCAWCAS